MDSVLGLYRTRDSLFRSRRPRSCHTECVRGKQDRIWRRCYLFRVFVHGNLWGDLADSSLAVSCRNISTSNPCEGQCLGSGWMVDRERLDCEFLPS